MLDCEDFDISKLYDEFQKSVSKADEKVRHQESFFAKFIDDWQKRLEDEEKTAMGSLDTARRRVQNKEKETEKIVSGVRDLETSIKIVLEEKAKKSKIANELEACARQNRSRLDRSRKALQKIKQKVDAATQELSSADERANHILGQYKSLLGIEFSTNKEKVMICFKQLSPTEPATGHQVTLRPDKSSFTVLSTSPSIKIPKVYKYSSALSQCECWKLFLVNVRENFASLYS